MKKTILKLMPVVGMCAAISFTSCSKDKGNYTYSDKNIITIENIPALTSVLANAEYVDLKPVITSSIDGDVKADDANYSFTYMRKNSEGKWVQLGSEKDLHILAEMSAGTNNCYFAVTDNRTGVQTIYPFDVRATTITSEGWLVLCNEGAEEKVRMDMLSQISLNRVTPAYNVLPTDEVNPMYHATKIGYVRTYGGFSNIFMFSETDSYVVPTADSYAYGELGKLTQAYEFKANQFLTNTNDHVVNHVTLPYQAFGRPNAAICVSKEGNAYAYNYKSTNMSAAFEYPINTSTRGGNPEYKVSPCIGATELRFDGISTSYACALLYDVDNKRFIGWSSNGAANDDPAGITQKCAPITDPTDGKKFSFQTGMDLVCMLNTAQSSGTVYCIMQDGSKRHVYAISVLTDEFKQLDAFLNIDAPDFDKATCFAASSQYAVIYYAYKNKLYSYNLATKASAELDLDSKEEVTMLKFNRYDDPWGTGSGIKQSFLGKLDEATRQIYLDRQNELIVGSYDSSASDGNGGILRFYTVGDGGQNLALKKDQANDAERVWEFKDFARIVDVRYKEVK